MACSPARREQIADLAHGRLDETASGDLLEHIAACEPCSTEFDLVADLVAAGPDLAANQATTDAPAKNRLLLVLAAALLLVTPLLIWQPFGSPGNKSVIELADLTPIPEPEQRLRGEPSLRGPVFNDGMRAYGRNDFEAAREILGPFCADRPWDGLAHLYLGMATSQIDLEAAIAPLRIASDNDEGLAGERALWFLANVYIRLERIPEARAALTTLVELDNDYAINAEQLLDKLKDY